MLKNPSLRAFKCPSCGAPLEPEVATLTMKCAYCGGTVIIPESLRTPAKASGPTMGEVFDFGLRGLDMNKIVGNAMQLPQAISLAQHGQIDEAAAIYSQITGMEHADAVSAVKAMAAGHAVSLTPGLPGAMWGQVATNTNQSRSVVASSVATSDVQDQKSGRSGRSCGLLVGIIAAVGVVVVGLVAAALFLFKGSQAPASIVPLGFAHQGLTFGAEGIGAGMFQDPRSIGVDGDGNITVADFEDGRVQTFDSSGKFQSGFSLGGKKVYVTSMAVGRDGKIYVAHDQKIFVYDSAGKVVSQIGDDQRRYDSVTAGGDGKLYAIADSETIVRLKPDGTVDLEIPDTFTKIAGDIDIDTHVAADGLGNMYIVGAFHYLVLKYTADGTYVDQFGGEARSGATDEPGKFVSPQAIAVDGYGRVYVSDFLAIQVFDADGTYLNRIPMDQGVAFGMGFDDQNRLYVVTNQNHVLRYDVPPPSQQ
jgi:sugar lactone lactonase YvrE/DNA-directed RNA polymerase subunit RPC12/RpoP